MRSFFSNLATRLRRDQRGATAVEYGIMVSLIAVVIIVAVTLLGGTLEGHLQRRGMLSQRWQDLLGHGGADGKGGCVAARRSRNHDPTSQGWGRLRPAANPGCLQAPTTSNSRKAVPHVQDKGTGCRRGGVRPPRSRPGDAAAGHH